jgi:hypothetical protein
MAPGGNQWHGVDVPPGTSRRPKLRKRTYRRLATALSAAVLAACAGEQSPTAEPLTTEPVTGTEGEMDLEDAGPPPMEPFREDAAFAPDRIVLSADRAEPGEVIEVEWPEEDQRGLGYVLELQVGDDWDLHYFMVAGTAGSGEPGEWWAVDDAEGRGWDDIGVGGPGPDLVEIPEVAELADYRVCATDVPVCAPLKVDVE